MAEDFKACSIDGCNGNAHRRADGRKGWCYAHYKRWWRYGDPLGGGTMHGEPIRWLRDVAMSFAGSDCLQWPFSRSADGYARVWLDGNKQQATRIICAEVNGAPPSLSHEAAHSCGKGHLGCVNPKHLYWATKSENENDKLQFGTRARGERQGGARLTEPAVREIRSLAGVLPQTEIAKRFGVCQRTISFIVRRETWAHVP